MPAYLSEYVRTVRVPDSLTPLKIGGIGWFDTQAWQFWPACLLPFSANISEEIRVHLVQRYELHIGWMNAKNRMFFMLARLLYQQDAFEKRPVNFALSFYKDVHIKGEGPS